MIQEMEICAKRCNLMCALANSFGVHHNIENNYSNSLHASRGLISRGSTRFLHAGFGHGLKHIHTRVS